MTTENRQKNCPHQRISPIVVADHEGQPENAWCCDFCGMQFFPMTVMATAQDTSAEVLDGIAGTLSAVLWDLQERTFDKYGVQVPEEPETAAEDCRGGHLFLEGANVCDYCGAPRFLGGEMPGKEMG